VQLVSRNRNVFKSFPGLCEGLARDLKGRRCVLDGGIVCLDSDGKPLFAGVFLEGSMLRSDDSADENLYGKKLTPKEIIREGKVGNPFVRQGIDCPAGQGRPRTCRTRSPSSDVAADLLRELSPEVQRGGVLYENS